MDLSRRDLLRAGTAGTATALVTPGLILPGDAAFGAEEDKRRKRFPGDPGRHRLYYGASTPWDVDRWERQLGARLSMHRMYFQPHNLRGIVKKTREDVRKGRLPHISTKVPNNDWRGVGRGEYNDWLRDIARGLDRIGKPIFFTLHHEPENDRSDHSGRSPRDFVRMTNRAIEIFDHIAPKVTVFPVLQGWMHRSRWNDPRDWYVRHAKIYGVDLYNGWSPSNGQRWRSFAYLLGQVKPYTHGKPIAIGEYGCRTDRRNPGRAARWMRNAYKVAHKRNVVSMSYFNSYLHSPDGSWELDRERGRVFERKLKHRRTR
jgi:hypothetical protein